MFSTIDATSRPPRVDIPREYNAAQDIVDRHLGTERAGHTAIVDVAGAFTYAQLAERINRAGNALRDLGVRMENRVAMCMLDSVDFPAVFLGAIRIGAIPIPLNTLLTAADYDYMLRDSRAHTLVVSAELYPVFAPVVAEQPWLRHVVVAGNRCAGGDLRLADLMEGAGVELDPAPTTSDDVAFWLYTSGTTGPPKGAMHLHRHLVHTVAGYGLAVLGVRPDDVIFSAAKLFFAYGLGNALTIPLYVGATAVLHPGRPTPDAVMRILNERQPTLFFGVPTLYGNLLADPANDRSAGSARLRRCISAGEPLPVGVARAWEERFGIAPLDGIGTTEMLHVFLSNRTGDHRYGTTGREPVPGYELKLVGEDGEPVAAGRDWRALCPRDHRRGRLLEPAREEPQRLSRSLDPDRRQVSPRRGGVLRVRGAHGRHAQGRRDLGLAVRGGGCAHRARRGARSRGGGREGREWPRQAQGVRRADRARPCLARACRRAPGLRQGTPRPLQVPAMDRVHRRIAEDGDRQDQAFSVAGVIETGFFTAAGGRIEYARWGTADFGGPPLVLLHEGLGCVSMWRDWPADLAHATGREVLAYSRFGYGGSSPAELPRPLDFMTREACDVLPRVLEEAGMEAPVLVGHSDGGTIALLCAAAGEVPLGGIVTLAAHAFNEPRCIAGVEAAREAFLKGELREGLYRHHGQRTDDAFWGWCDAWLDPRFERWSIETDLDCVGVELLVVQGRDDIYGSLHQVEVIASRTRGSCRTLVLDECGHSPHRDQARATTDAVVRFLASL